MTVPAVSAREQTAEWTELKRLAAAATPGPWQVVTRTWECVVNGFARIGRGDADMNQVDIDAAYIAAANPQAVRALLAVVEQLREENEQAVMERDSARDYISSLHGAKNYETMVQLADKLLAAEAVVEQQTAALKEIEYACLRQYADWMHFHELAMAEPFKAESEAQMFAQRIQGLALEALRAGAEPGGQG